MWRYACVVLCAFYSLSLHAVEVIDDVGNRVALATPAKRIISLAPHLTEQLFAIGAGEYIVGAVDYSDYPEAAKTIPRVGSYTNFDMERILSLNPDLVVGWRSGNHPQQLARLEEMRITVYRSEPLHLEDIASGMLKLGELTGKSEQAGEQAESFRQKLAWLREATQGRSTRAVFYQIWNQPLMTVSGDDLINEVISLCHGSNVFAEMPTPNPKVSKEAVIAANPEVIIASGMGQARPEWLDEWRKWPQLKAVEQKRLYVIDPSIIQRATPRLLAGAEVMCRFIHPESFAQKPVNSSRQ